MGTITKGVQLAKDKLAAPAASRLAAVDDIVGPSVRRVEANRRVMARSRVLTLDSPNPARAAYKMLRTRVMRRMQAQGWRSLAITSLNQGEGKTLTALNLAISIVGALDQSVILVDLDLRKPSMYRYLGISAEPGLSHWLKRSADLSDVLVCPGIDRLYVLPNDLPIDASSETLQSQRMVELLEALKTEYPSSLLIFDLPPLLEADDMLAFSPYVDALLLVVSQGQTARERLFRAKELLEDATLLGIVLNKSDEAAASYY